MNTAGADDGIEARLTRAFAVDPSADELSWLDRRVSEVMAGGNAQPRRGWVRPLLRPVPLIAAFVLLTGAVAGALSLIEQTATEAGGGFAAAWEKAEVLEITATDQGYEITLERVYADVNQVLAFLSVRRVGDDAGVDPQGSVFLTSSLRDPAGRALDRPYGMSVGATDLAAIIDSFGPPSAEPGTYVLTITSVEADPPEGSDERLVIEGEWEFEFDLPAPAGTVVAADVTASDAGVTVELAELRISPTMISGRMYLTMEDGSPAPVWIARITEIRQDGTDVNPNPGQDPVMAGVPLREEGRTGFQFQTSFGTDTPSGTWEIEISEVSFPELYHEMLPPEPGGESPMGAPLPTPDESYRPRPGTWTLEVTVP